MSIIINSPTVPVQTDTEPNQAPNHEEVPDSNQPANFEVPNRAVSAIQVTPINSK